MPYASKAQQRKFHADPKLRKYAAEFDAATEAAGGFKSLPERAANARHKRKKARRRASS